MNKRVKFQIINRLELSTLEYLTPRVASRASLAFQSQSNLVELRKLRRNLKAILDDILIYRSIAHLPLT
ncbi:hypothetical protein [Microcoleus sp. PH2017_27_LUM_O_A]|uniref:hypothetical protein n=1 Tax=Microcoleus sp. PH2017_27_LUM_O_A TaxID=2798837 RepID=UPI001D4AAF03|nr:hypothetical protein [Microcoleus sp. PH2017_27_LUM_O_A]MCC3463614.1 hypothetical protein [Microcoleus sp. PH2017_11_PCY_U_A]